MPLYLYACPECGNETDTIHSITEDPTVTCDQCGDPMTRKPQSTNNRFLGAGFYVTDKNKK